MRAITRSITLPGPIATTLTLTEVAQELVVGALADYPERTELTLLAISISNLTDQVALQLELPVDRNDPRRPGSARGAARWAVDQAIDVARKRFGRDAVAYASTAFSDHGRVPDEFRELAERVL